MYFKRNLCVFAIIVLVKAVEDPVRISLQPDEILKSFKSIVSSDYIKMLANEFATKAAEHFISEMKTKEMKMERDYNTRLRWQELLSIRNDGKRQNPRFEKATEESLPLKSAEDRGEWNKIHAQNTPEIRMKNLAKHETEKPSILNEEQAMALLDDPSPDGDNLGEQLTDAEVEDTKTIPVIGVMKINGVYYRRLLGMI